VRPLTLRKWWWVPALLLVGGLVGWARWWRPVSAEAVAVDRGVVVREAFGRGTVESVREASVGFDLSGRLSDVLVDEGDRVSLGQVLARLETDQAEADLRSALTNVAAARSSLSRLAAEEERARAGFDAAQREAGRTGKLVAGGVATPQQGDDATDRVRLARADLDRVLAQRAEATRGIDVASGGAEQRRATLVRASLLAPFDGLVTRRLREPGDTVTIGASVLRVVDTDRVVVSAALDETVLDDLGIDQAATLRFPGDDLGFAGLVTRVGWEADRATRELLVEVTPTDLGRRVAIGQRADVRVTLERREDALRVPTALLHRDEGGVFVLADRGGRVTRVDVALGLSGAEHVEVVEGLAEGDRVLGAPASAVGRRWVSP
jgi:HlyD family secretion protein